MTWLSMLTGFLYNIILYNAQGGLIPVDNAPLSVCALHHVVVR